MPRFFFNVRTDHGVERDEVGLDYADLDSAYLAAFAAAQGLVAEMVLLREDCSRHTFEICLEDGETLLCVPFMEVMPARRAAPVDLTLKRTRIVARRLQELARELDEQIRRARIAVSASRAALERSQGIPSPLPRGAPPVGRRPGRRFAP